MQPSPTEPAASAGIPTTPLPPPPTPRWFKAVTDRLLALLALVLASWLIALIALAIVVEDLVRGRGLATPFYGEPRVSAGRLFRMYKFRVFSPATLRQLRAAPPDQPSIIKHLERMPGFKTGVGTLLNKFYLDELPQLWNVLTGAMSLVGPRPAPLTRPERVAVFSQCGMRSGMTGLYQLRKAWGNKILEGDLEYYEQFKTRGPLSLFAYDLSILYRTIFKMGKGEGL